MSSADSQGRPVTSTTTSSYRDNVETGQYHQHHTITAQPGKAMRRRCTQLLEGASRGHFWDSSVGLRGGLFNSARSRSVVSRQGVGRNTIWICRSRLLPSLACTTLHSGLGRSRQQHQGSSPPIAMEFDRSTQSPKSDLGWRNDCALRTTGW